MTHLQSRLLLFYYMPCDLRNMAGNVSAPIITPIMSISHPPCGVGTPPLLSSSGLPFIYGGRGQERKSRSHQAAVLRGGDCIVPVPRSEMKALLSFYRAVNGLCSRQVGRGTRFLQLGPRGSPSDSEVGGRMRFYTVTTLYHPISFLT